MCWDRVSCVTNVLGQCHVSRIWESSKACIVWRGKVKERDQMEELGVGGSIILKWVNRTKRGVEIVD